MTNIFEDDYNKLLEINYDKSHEVKLGKITREQYEEWQRNARKAFFELLDKVDPEMKEDNSYDIEFEAERSYRRGYHQGFHNARKMLEVTEDMVYKWRHSQKDDPKCHPPGSYFDGTIKLVKMNVD